MATRKTIYLPRYTRGEAYIIMPIAFDTVTYKITSFEVQEQNTFSLRSSSHDYLDGTVPHVVVSRPVFSPGHYIYIYIYIYKRSRIKRYLWREQTQLGTVSSDRREMELARLKQKYKFKIRKVHWKEFQRVLSSADYKSADDRSLS